MTGLKNFLNLYKPLANDWRAYNNSESGKTLLVAEQRLGQPEVVHRLETWQQMKGIADNE